MVVAGLLERGAKLSKGERGAGMTEDLCFSSFFAICVKRLIWQLP